MTIATEPYKIPRKFLERQSGYTTHLLGECITNLALNKPCIYVIYNFNCWAYMIDLARKISHSRGFPECREKIEHHFALKNGGANLHFISLSNEYLVHTQKGLGIRGSNKPLFVDHYVWESRKDWPQHLRIPSFYAEPIFGNSNCFTVANL